MPSDNQLWITWERQRRSISLAQALGLRLYVLLEQSDDIPFRVIRYPYLVWKTLGILFRHRPDLCFCQNPSIVLAILLGLLRRPLRYRLVVDRHSNFNFEGRRALKWRIFDFLSRWSLRMADLTIVTNEPLAQYVTSLGGRAFLLQDRMPVFGGGPSAKLDGHHTVAFICSFDSDEPIEEVMEAARGLTSDWRIYITGNYRRYLHRLPPLNAMPGTVSLTGFLEESQYEALLRTVDVVMVLTKHEHTLMCGAYEAVALGKATVTSDTAAMRSYFRRGFVFTNHSPDAIRTAMAAAVKHRQQLEQDARSLRIELEHDWQMRFGDLLDVLGFQPACPSSRAEHGDDRPTTARPTS